MNTLVGASVRGVGFRQVNSNERPTVFLEKRWVSKNKVVWEIHTPNGLYRGVDGEVMQYLTADLDTASKVVSKLRKVYQD